MSKATISYSDMASKIAVNLLGELKLDAEKESLREKTNVMIVQMNKDGVKVGSRAGKNPDSVACSFHDTLTANGIGSKVASNYLGTFKAHVESGKPITDWNLQRSKAKNGKGGKGKGKAAFADLFLKAFNHDDGKSFEVLSQEIEIRFLNDEGSVYDMFVSFLKKEGFEIKE
jgi:hypothetical protein